jgi:hypothetical protein
MKKILTLWFAFISPFLPLIGKELPVPYGLEALSKQWRVDLYWTEDPVWTANKLYFYEVQKGSAIEGPYQPLHEGVQKFQQSVILWVRRVQIVFTEFAPWRFCLRKT